jgi:hypothetical protein
VKNNYDISLCFLEAPKMNHATGFFSVFTRFELRNEIPVFIGSGQHSLANIVGMATAKRAADNRTIQAHIELFPLTQHYPLLAALYTGGKQVWINSGFRRDWRPGSFGAAMQEVISVEYLELGTTAPWPPSWMPTLFTWP